MDVAGASHPDPITVFLVEDHSLMRDGIKYALLSSADIEVIGEADTGLDALEALGTNEPDVVLLDYRLPDIDGVEVMRRLAGTSGKPKVIFLSCFDEPWRVRQALREGASGYLSKRGICGRRLAETVRAACAGDTAITSDVASSLAESVTKRPAASGRSLTARELEVWRLLAGGATNAEIATHLFIAERTVKFHVGNILRKTGARNRAEAAAMAHRSGMFEPGA